MLTARGTLALALLEQYRRGGDRDHALLSEAAVLAQAAVSADPNNAQAHVVLGEAFLKTQQFTKARTEIQKALSIQPGIPAGNRELALLSLIEGKADEAMEYASAAQKNDPAYFESPRIKGIVQLFKMQYEDASQLFDQATRLGAPDSLLTVGFKFRAWANLDQEDKMISFCQQMMDGADDPKKVILHYWIGRAYQLKGKLDESVANFDQGSQLADRIVAQDPKSYTTFAYYALLQARRAKSPQTAVRLMQRAVTLEPSSARVHYWSARVYAIQRNKAAALGELGKAVAIEYSFPEILDPDFLSVWDDPQFAVTITKKTQ
jgi:tetratricopeptide (TPR) repeat protein